MQGEGVILRSGDPTVTFEMAGVSFSREGRALLTGLDLCVTERRVGIVGRNGSGKTTLARVLSGLVAPDQGEVRMCGVDIAKDRRAAIQTVGILFQNPDHQIIFPTVEEELGFGLLQVGASKPEAERQVADILAMFDKSHWAAAATHQLSQGQKQLVCLMAIIAMAPKVVVLDEPFSGLDIPTRAQLTRYFERIDAALIHITHDPQALRGYERVIWLEEGRIKQDGEAGPTLAAFDKHMTDLGGHDDISDLAG